MNNKKNVIFELQSHNWGMKRPGSWDKTTWYVLDDYTVQEKVDYIPSPLPSSYEYSFGAEPYSNISDKQAEKYFDRIYSLSKDEIERFNQLIDMARNNTEKVDANDGTAWKFICYKDNKVFWKRPLGYIYTIEVLEELTRLINNN